MKKATKIIGLTTLVAFTIFNTSCIKKGCTDPTAVNFVKDAHKDDESCFYETTNSTNKIVQGTITQNTTWTSDKIYELKGKVVVDNGATLTIEAGTIIKGQEGSGTNASALIIARGAKIIAEGTETNPIIFTSVLDNIQKGELLGTNLDEGDNGKWGGLIILGKAPISAGDGDTETQIEGVPATEAYGTFGGNQPNDNSGVLSHISIRHGGALIGAGNEINGLTLGGVGAGTVIDNIEIIATLDDGVEFFGGTVNVSNLVVAFQGDDGIDIDMNYAGTINNFAVIHGINTDEGLEIDGPEGITNTNGLFTLSNGTIKTIDGIGTGADFKSKAQGTINNVSWLGYTGKVVKIRTSYSDTLNCVDKEDAYAHLSGSNPTLVFNNTQVIGNTTLGTAINVYTKSYQSSANDNCTNFRDTQAESILSTGGVSIENISSTGVNTATFSWTWSALTSKL